MKVDPSETKFAMKSFYGVAQNNYISPAVRSVSRETDRGDLYNFKTDEMKPKMKKALVFPRKKKPASKKSNILPSVKKVSDNDVTTPNKDAEKDLSDSPQSEKKFFKSRSVPMAQREKSSSVVVKKGFNLKFNPKKINWNTEKKARSPLKIAKRKTEQENMPPLKRPRTGLFTDSPDLFSEIDADEFCDEDQSDASSHLDSGIRSKNSESSQLEALDENDAESVFSTESDDVSLMSVVGSEKSLADVSDNFDSTEETSSKNVCLDLRFS